jgi:hypothetical protein
VSNKDGDGVGRADVTGAMAKNALIGFGEVDEVVGS